MTGRYATAEERQGGYGWCRVCGALLGYGERVCDGKCLPARATPQGIPTERGQ